MEGATINFFDIIGFLVLLFLAGVVVFAIGIQFFVVLYAAFANPKPAPRTTNKNDSEI